MPDSKPRLLVFELHHLGDALMSFPLIRSAADKFEVWVVCTPGTKELYLQILPEDRILPWLPVWQGGSWKELRTAIQTWRSLNAAATVCVWADARVHFLMFFSRVAKRVGFPMNNLNYYAHEGTSRKRQLFFGQILQEIGAMISGGNFLTDPLQRHGYDQHHVQDWQQLAECLEIPWNVATPWLRTEPENVPPALKDFFKLFKDRDQKLWMVHSGGRLAAKQWPRERFRELLDRHFRRNGIPCVIVGPGWESEKSDDLFFYAPLLALGEFAAVMNEIDYFLGNDSFPAHLAAALGKKSMAIFGSANPDWFAPWGKENISITAKTPPTTSDTEACQIPNLECLERIHVEDIATRLSVDVDGCRASKPDSVPPL